MSVDEDQPDQTTPAPRHDPRMTAVQRDLDLVKEGIAKVLEGQERERRAASTSTEPEMPPIFQTQSEQDAFEEVRHRATSATGALLKTGLNYGAVYDLNATMVSTDTDLSHWVWLDVMDILKRRDKLKAYLGKVGQRTFREKFGKFIPYVLAAAVAIALGVMVLQPKETTLLATYFQTAWADPRFQAAFIGSVLVVLGAMAFYILKGRRDRRPKARLE